MNWRLFSAAGILASIAGLGVSLFPLLAPSTAANKPVFLSISGAIAIAAVLVAGAAWMHRNSLRSRVDLVKSAPGSERAQLVATALETYHLRHDNLTREQKFQLLMEVVREKGKRLKVLALSGVAVAAIVGGVTVATAYIAVGEGREARTLESMKEAIQGTWTGIATPPAWWGPPYKVRLVFAELTYEAYGSDRVALYYGDDGDSPRKRYQLVNVDSDGRGRGEMTVTFDVGADNRAILEKIFFADQNTSLSFEYWYANARWPIEYRLTRESPRHGA